MMAPKKQFRSASLASVVGLAAALAMGVMSVPGCADEPVGHTKTVTKTTTDTPNQKTTTTEKHEKDTTVYPR